MIYRTLLLILFSTSLQALEIGKSPRFSIRYKTALAERAVYSPDSRVLAMTDWKKVALFNADTGELLKVLGEFPDKVMNLSFSGSGRLLASDAYGGSAPSHVVIWDAKSGRKIREIADVDSCESIEFSPDEKTIALACILAADGKDASVTLWDVATGQKSAVLDKRPIGEYSPGSLVFSRDGRFLINAVANRTHGIQIWDLAARKLHQFLPTALDVTAVALDPAGKMLVAALYIPESAVQRPEGIISVYDFASRARLFDLKGPKGHVTAFSFHPGGRFLASSEFGSSPSFSIWDLEGRKAAYRHESGTRPSLDIAFSPDGKSLAVVVNTYGDIGNPSTVEVFDTGSPEELKETGALNDISTFRTGERVRARIDGKWYTGVVNKTGNGQYLLQMDNSQPEYWKWVRPADLRPSGAGTPGQGQKEQDSGPASGGFSARERVLIQWNNKWYPGQILEVRASGPAREYLIQYDSYDASWNEWVKADRLKKK